MHKQSQLVNSNIKSSEETPLDDPNIPNFRSFAIKITSSIQAHWGIEHFCLIYIPKFKFIVSADIQGCINVWSSTNFKKQFRFKSYDTDIHEVLFFEESDFLYVASHHITIYKISKTGIYKVKFYQDVAPVKALGINKKNLFAISFNEKIQIWEKKNLSYNINLEHPTLSAGCQDMIYFQKKSLLICGINEGYLLIFDINSNFAKISSQKIGKCEVDVTIGSHEKLDILIICRQSGMIEIWKLTEKNTLVHQTQIKVYADRIYNYLPAIINHEDAILMVGFSFEPIVLYVGAGYRHERILNRKYSAMLSIPEKRSFCWVTIYKGISTSLAILECGDKFYL